MVRPNDILMVVNIIFERINRKGIIGERMGVERGTMQQSNGDGKGRGEGESGTKVSNNVSILFARVPSLYSTLYFFRLILLTDRGLRTRANSVRETKQR